MKNRQKLIAGLLLLLIAFPLAAGGQREQEETRLDIERLPRVFIAPQNPASGNTELVLQPTIVPPTNAVIRSYELRVYDSAGQSVWSRSEEVTERRGFFGRLFNIGEEPGIDLDILARLSWPGVDQDGTFVDDGDFIYQLTVRDSEGNVARTPPMNVTVDNTAPVIELLEAEFTIFSPDDSGIRDTLPIRQRGSREVSWVGRITDSGGRVVREFRWVNPVQYDPQNPTRQRPEGDMIPENVEWDGRDEAGNVLPDGIFTYELIGTDRAGNVARRGIDRITLSTEAGDLLVRATRTIFSPGTASPFGSTTLLPEVAALVDVERWTIAVAPDARPAAPVRTFSGEGEVPAELVFDGNDNQGRRVADGIYRVLFSARFVNGMESAAAPVRIEIDTVAPRAQITVDPPVFGGETRPTTTIDATWDRDVEWTGVVTAPGLRIEEPLYPLALQLGIDESILPFEWDGTDLDGNPIPDGTYTGYIFATDAAGNRGESNRVTLRRDTRSTPIALQADRAEFTPDFIGPNDSVTFTPVLEVEDSIERMRLEIRDSQGRVARAVDQRGGFTEFVWNGRDNAGRLLPEGRYTAELTVFYENGNQPTAGSGPIQLTILGVGITITAPYNAISPTGDGVRDTIEFTIAVAGQGTVARWAGEIRDAQNRVVVSAEGTGPAPRSAVWDGRNAQGQVVEGRYTAHARVEFEQGGSLEGRFAETIFVDTTPPTVDLQLSAERFAPDGDGNNDEITFRLTARDALSGIGDWELVIRDPMGNGFRTFRGTGNPPATIRWDGTSDTGERVQSASRYAVVFTARDLALNSASVQRSVEIDVLVLRVGDRYRIVVPSIHFRPNTANLFQVEDEQLRENLRILRRVGEVLQRFDNHTILVEGHANHVLYFDPVLRNQEQQGTLIPLSRDRARTVREALAILGVDLTNMRAVGIGGARPEVQFSDYDNIWKNRRVEFWLDRRPD